MDDLSPPLPGGLRPADPSDVPELARLWAFTFPGERTPEDRARALRTGGPYGGVETAFVTGPAARVDGALRGLSLSMSLFGQVVPTLGVAAVAVAPHARRRGVATAMCRSLLEIGRERGDLLAALYPFRTDFYLRLGFGLAGALHRYRFPPESLPLSDGADRILRLDDPGGGGALPPEELLPRVHARLLPRGHGLITRSDRRWEALLREAPVAFGILRKGITPEQARAAAEVGGEPDPFSGYLIGAIRKLRGGHGHGFHVQEFLAEDRESREAALGWISAQRDAWRTVEYDALPGEQLHELLAHPRLPGTRNARTLWFPSATILRGPMVRILHPGALLGRLGADPGTRLALHDPNLPQNTGTWEVPAEGGEAVRVSDDPGPDPHPVDRASVLLVEGRLPGLALPRPDFDPLLGIPEFRLLDPF
jgi:predicted acetyltransferase